MSENNLPNIDGEENVTPAAEENTSDLEENTSAENAAYAEEQADDIAAVEEEIFVEADEVPVFDTEAEPVVPEVPDLTPAPKKSGAGKVIAIVVAAVIILAAIGVGVYKVLTRNPYNELGYINISGRTIGEVAEQAGTTLEEFLADYGLPADMPEDTDESAAYYSIPTSRIAEMYGMEMSELKEILGLGDDVTEDTPWGEAEGKAPLSKYIGEDRLEAFKTEYGLGEDVTADTTWGEVRNIVDRKNLEKQKEAAAAQAQDAESPAVGDNADVAGTEGAADADAAAGADGTAGTDGADSAETGNTEAE